MHQIEWTTQAYSDLQRFYDFLAPINSQAAIQILNMLATAPEKLINNPRIGENLPEFSPREVRKLIVSRYELRYEVKNNTIYILKLWHVRENR
ncbi:MAG: type II toxin-antitoxin system RelE/ParE family toxin [Myxococcaceae bacterium]